MGGDSDLDPNPMIGDAVRLMEEEDEQGHALKVLDLVKEHYPRVSLDPEEASILDDFKEPAGTYQDEATGQLEPSNPTRAGIGVEADAERPGGYALDRLLNRGVISQEQYDEMQAVRATEKDPRFGAPSVIVEQITGRGMPHAVATKILQMLPHTVLAEHYGRAYDRIFVKGGASDPEPRCQKGWDRSGHPDNMVLSSENLFSDSGSDLSSEDESSSEEELEGEEMGGHEIGGHKMGGHEKITAGLPEQEDEAMEEVTTAGARGESTLEIPDDYEAALDIHPVPGPPIPDIGT